MVRVLLADDQAVVCSALRLLLEQEAGLQVVGEAADAAAVLLSVKNEGVDLVLLDWELPGLPAARLVRLLHDERPDTRVLAMSGRPEVCQAALDAGCNGFISKMDPPEALRKAIRDYERVSTPEQQGSARPPSVVM